MYPLSENSILLVIFIMVCSICKDIEHNASSCNGPLITEWAEKIKSFWVVGHNNSPVNDEAVKEWVRTTRIKMPTINRLWCKLDSYYYQTWSLFLRGNEGDQYAEILFIRSKPNTVTEFKERIANYIRPVEPEIDMDRIIEERDERMRIRLHQRNVRELARLTRLVSREPIKPDIQIKMVTDNLNFFPEIDCVACLNPLNSGNTVAFNCNHVTCATCAPKVIKMVASQCPTCRNKINTIQFTPNILPDEYNNLSSSLK